MANYNKNHPWRREFAIREQKRMQMEDICQRGSSLCIEDEFSTDLRRGYDAVSDLRYNGQTLTEIMAGTLC